ncbi:MAG: porin [Rubrivivax sp.]
MKKSLLALAALTAFTGAASAQSSVTLFGIVDLAGRQVTAGGRSQKQLAPDGFNSNRIGFRGVEDLGGGLRAGFWLEAGIDPSIGTAGGGNGNAAGNSSATTAPGGSPAAFFNRRATVSLIGGFGEVRLGRDYTASFWNTTVFDPFGTNGVGSFLTVVDTLGTGSQTTVRANNTIGYFLPGGLGGLYGQALVALGEAAVASGLPAGNSHKSFRVGYAAGPINVAYSWGDTDNGIGGADLKHTNLGGMYDLKAVQLYAQLNNTAGSGAAAVNGRKQRVTLLGVTAPMGATQLRASYIKADGSGPAAGDNKDASQISLGAVQNMSKRTALYGTYSRISNSGAAAFSLGPVPAAAGGKATGYEVGVRHSF